MTVGPVASVGGIASGDLPTSDVDGTNLRITESRLLNTERASLYLEMEKRNIAQVNLSDSSVIFTTQIFGETTVGPTLSISADATGINDALFVPFDQERYSIVYSDGTIENISSEQVTLTIDSKTLVFTGLSKPNEINITVNVTAIKPNIKSKIKVLSKSKTLLVDKISSGLSSEFGMTQNGVLRSKS